MGTARAALLGRSCTTCLHTWTFSHVLNPKDTCKVHRQSFELAEQGDSIEGAQMFCPVREWVGSHHRMTV